MFLRKSCAKWPKLKSYFAAIVLASLVLTAPAGASQLDQEVGRNEVRILTRAFPLPPGRSPKDYALSERLDALGFIRVHQRPTRSGQYFWGEERFWIYRPATRWGGRDRPARLWGLRKENGKWTFVDADGSSLNPAEAWLPPLLLGESFQERRYPRRLLEWNEFPESVWQAVVAIEDERFFDHSGVDSRAIARATLANLKAGEVKQGGSTLTQQLIKNRDLSGKRSFSRKVNEALRSLHLEAEFSKEEILGAYLNSVYLGHVNGYGVYGIGAASEVYFSKQAEDLSLAEAATLAAMVQGPNRLHPVEHPERVGRRRDVVLQKMVDLGWVEETAAGRAKSLPVRVQLRPPGPSVARQFREHLHWTLEEEGVDPKGIIVETSLDPWMQKKAEDILERGLTRLRRTTGFEDLQGALVALDASHGGILAYVGGDRGVAFDRCRRARRQPGSTLKPFVLLEAFQSCGREAALFPSIRVLDAPLEISLPKGTWTPQNFDGGYRGEVTVREAFRDSLNIPFVRLARRCGFEAVGKRMRRAGLLIPEDPPPSMVLGGVETTPLALAEAYTALAGQGRRWKARSLWRAERSSGRKVLSLQPSSGKVASPEAAWLVKDLLEEAVEQGTARAVQISGEKAGAKTGTSPKDAWLAGFVGDLVVVVWVGRDEGGPLGLTGSRAAAPLWHSFVSQVASHRSSVEKDPPLGIVERWYDPHTGRLTRKGKKGAVRGFFKRGALPPRERWFSKKEALPVVE